MKKAILVIMVLIVAAAAGFGVYSLTKNKEDHDHADHSHDTATVETGTAADAPMTETEAPAADATVITYTNNGFSPDTVTVRVGSTVTVKNDSSRDVQFSSDSHPTHTINSELNLPVIGPGQSRSFVVERTGTYGYHDHLDSTRTGTIIVE